MLGINPELLKSLDNLIASGKRGREVTLPGTEVGIDMLFLLKEFKGHVVKSEEGLRIHFPPLKVAIPIVEHNGDVVPIPLSAAELTESEERLVEQARTWYQSDLLPRAMNFKSTLEKLKETDSQSLLRLGQALCERPEVFREIFQEKRPLEVLGKTLADCWEDSGAIGFGDILDLVSLSGFAIPDKVLMQGFDNALDDEGDSFTIFSYLMAHSFAKRVLNPETARGAWIRHGPDLKGEFRALGARCYALHGLPLHSKAASLAIVETPDEILEDEEGSFADAHELKIEALQALAKLCQESGEYEDGLLYFKRLEDHHLASPMSYLSDDQYLAVVSGIYECRKQLHIPSPDYASEQLQRLKTHHVELLERNRVLEQELTRLQSSDAAGKKAIETTLKKRFGASFTRLASDAQGYLKVAEQLLQEIKDSPDRIAEKGPIAIVATALAVEVQLKVSVFSRELLQRIGEPHKDGLRDFSALIKRGHIGAPDWHPIKNTSSLRHHVPLLENLAKGRNLAVHPKPGRTGYDLDRFLSEVYESQSLVEVFAILTDWKDGRSR